METEKVAVVAQEVSALLGQKSIARQIRDFLLLFLNRIRFEDFEEHRVFLRRLLENSAINRRNLLIGILLSFCKMAKEIELPINEVLFILDELTEKPEDSQPSSLDALPFASARTSADGKLLDSNAPFRQIAKEHKSFSAIFPKTVLKEGDFTAESFEGDSFELHIRKKGDDFFLVGFQIAKRSGEEFHQMLRRLRKEQGYTLIALAERLGIARGYLHNIERGKVVPSYELIEKTVALLDPEGKNGLFLSGAVAKIPLRYRALLSRMV